MPDSEVKNNENAKKTSDEKFRIPPVEAREMEDFIISAQGAHSTVGMLTILGIVVLGLALLYYQKLDFVRVEDNWQRFPDQLTLLVDNQSQKDANAFATVKDATVESPIWPQKLYRKMRFDIYAIAGLMFLLSIIFLLSEKAKLRRNDLLVYRALAREVEKLRMRVKELENKK